MRSFGLLQSLEWTAYDLLFLLRPAEPKENRVVIVGWGEEDIQLFEQDTISDHTLLKVLSTIKKQQASIIGLDIVRDIPVASSVLSDQHNQQAYAKLVDFYNSTPNLIGIEKVIPPYFDPPKVLAKKKQVAASDLLTDDDNIIRRAYIYPLEDEKGQIAYIPALGVTLAFDYLANKGWKAERIAETSNTIKASNPQTKSQLILEHLKTFDGSYIRKEEGTKILVNWRKADWHQGKSEFTEVSVANIVDGSIPEDIFKDKIVLIGNTAISKADRHFLPIKRWDNKSKSNKEGDRRKWDYGVEVHAQIASSVVNAALDGRPLIKSIPEWSEWAMLILTILGIAAIAEKWQKASPLNFCLIAIGSTVIIISSLKILAIIAFTKGYWIPIIPSFLGSITTPIVICLAIYIRRIKQNNEDFKQLIKDLNHSLQNHLSSIRGNLKTSHSIAQVLAESTNIQETIEEIEENLGEPPFEALKERLDDLVTQTSELNKKQENIQKYFNVAYFGKDFFRFQPTFFNDFIHTTIQKNIAVKQSQYKIRIELRENYDPLIKEINIHRDSMISVLENLIDNAYYAIKSKIHERPEHRGNINIQTRKINKKIELSIEDNGIGITDSIINDIFLPFNTYKAKNQGQGLGLSIVQAAIDRHRGKVRVETKENEGSKFIILFE